MKTENETVYSFPKNPLEEVRAGVTVFRGKQYVDLRIYYKGDDGEFHPSKKGLTLSIELFPELEEAVKNCVRSWASKKGAWRSSLSTLRSSWFQGELPGAIPVFGMLVWRAPDTFRHDSGIDGGSEEGILHHSRGSARIVGKALAFPGFLDPTLDHPKDERVFIDLLHPLFVDSSVHTETQGRLEPFQPGKSGSPSSSLILNAS